MAAMDSKQTETPRVEGRRWPAEPWVWRDFGHGYQLFTQHGGSKCVLSVTRGRNGVQIGAVIDGRITEISADHPVAQRIVSCVNALAGTELPATVEPGAITRELERTNREIVMYAGESTRWCEKATRLESELAEMEGQLVELRQQAEQMQPVIEAARRVLETHAACIAAANREPDLQTSAWIVAQIRASHEHSEAIQKMGVALTTAGYSPSSPKENDHA